ncbi:MAG TPA: TIM barrel protein [Longimicrobiales bacterium]|nr:TIM barrel protein [Longimicrobiales bacterium]
MKRRDFLRTATVAGATMAVKVTPAAAAADGSTPGGPGPSPSTSAGTAQEPFTLDYAPHFGMFREHGGGDLVGELRFMADQGFRSLEDNGMRGRSVADQERIASEMGRLGMRMGVFVAHTIYWQEANLASGDADRREEFLSEIRASVEVARRVNATWMTVVPGHVDLRVHPDFQTAHVVESLKRAAELLEPHGLVMVLEPLNRRDHPGLFLSGIPQAYQICQAVDSPSCKILDDLYHQQITEGNLIPNLDAAWDEIAYIQLGDNPGRREPTTGEINYANVFRHLHAKGWDGILGMEHGNSRPGLEGEQAVIDAYRAVDPE